MSDRRGDISGSDGEGAGGGGGRRGTRSASRSRSRSPKRPDSRERRRERPDSRERRRGGRSRSRERRQGGSSRSRSRDRRQRSPSRDRHRRSRSRSRGRYDSRRSSPPRRPERSPPPAHGTQLFVAGIPFMFNERDVGDKFDRYGRVKDVRIVRNPGSGESRGFCFVSMEDEEGAALAVRKLDGSDWNGRRLLVEVAKRPRG